jgi:uracil-DNA glycosylase family 4
MKLHDIEMMIFNCPHRDSIECDARLRCHPIPGYGSADPDFLVLGINPGRRRGVWRNYESLEELKSRYFAECMNPQHPYGKLLERLRKLIPQFDIPKTVYISDIVKCPTRRGTPSRDMVERCVSTYLEKTIKVLDPKFIIGLGDLPAIHVGGFRRYGRPALSRNIALAGGNYWFISVTHPNAIGANVETIASAISKMVEQPEAGIISKPITVFPSPKTRKIAGLIEKKLFDLGYRKHKNYWVKGKRVVRLVHSSGFNGRIRILWRETWKDDHAVIYDYSGARGPACIVPISILFASSFVKQKQRSKAYTRSGYWWSQMFPRNHQLAKLVLGLKDRWDLL